jgi:hypothetical protein
MASITTATKARLQAADLVTVLTTRYQADNADATSSDAYTFTCGYLESMLAGIMADHPSVRKQVAERVAEIRARMVANGTFV